MSNSIESFSAIQSSEYYAKYYLLHFNLLSQPLVKNLWFLTLICLSILFILIYIHQALESYRSPNLNQKSAGELNSKFQAELEAEVLKRTAALGLANQDLQASTNLMEKIANLNPYFLCVYDLEKKYNIYSNHYIGEILGYAAAEVEEINVQLFNKLVHPEDMELVMQHHQKCLLLAQDDYLELEYRMKDRLGQWHWLHSKDTIFERNELGKPTQILGMTQDITETKKIQLESAKLNLLLREKVTTLEVWHERRIMLGRMNEFLQACLSISEAESILSDVLPQLFPHTHGVVYLMNNSKNLLNAVAVWGLAHSQASFEPDECWSLRRSSTHVMNSAKSSLHCNHVEHQSSNSTLCQPMIAKGETLGMLYLRFNDSATSQLIRELAETVAQNIAMSFANLTLQEKLRYQSLRDPLTGLFNRRYLQESLNKEIERANRKQHFIGVMMLDIDYFKRFNDIYGHSAGDQVLQEVANYLISEIRQYDTACRYGGEELVLVLPDVSIENTIIRAEEIRMGISKLQLEHEGKKLESLGVSIGISCFPDDGITTDSLISNADKALYQAKNAGRNCVKRC